MKLHRVPYGQTWPIMTYRHTWRGRNKRGERDVASSSLCPSSRTSSSSHSSINQFSENTGTVEPKLRRRSTCLTCLHTVRNRDTESSRVYNNAVWLNHVRCKRAIHRHKHEDMTSHSSDVHKRRLRPNIARVAVSISSRCTTLTEIEKESPCAWNNAVCSHQVCLQVCHSSGTDVGNSRLSCNQSSVNLVVSILEQRTHCLQTAIASKATVAIFCGLLLAAHELVALCRQEVAHETCHLASSLEVCKGQDRRCLISDLRHLRLPSQMVPPNSPTTQKMRASTRNCNTKRMMTRRVQRHLQPCRPASLVVHSFSE